MLKQDVLTLRHSLIGLLPPSHSFKATSEVSWASTERWTHSLQSSIKLFFQLENGCLNLKSVQ